MTRLDVKKIKSYSLDVKKIKSYSLDREKLILANYYKRKTFYIGDEISYIGRKGFIKKLDASGVHVNNDCIDPFVIQWE